MTGVAEDRQKESLEWQAFRDYFARAMPKKK